MINKKPDTFMEWLEECPCPWFLDEYTEDSVTYQFIVSDEDEDEDEDTDR